MTGERGNKVLRLLDRCVGIPLVLGAGLVRRRRTPPRVLNRVGVLCLGCIGDLVILSGPLADLTSARPACRTTLFCSQANAGLARLLPLAADIVVLPLKNPLHAAALIRAQGAFNAWIDSGQWPRIGAVLTLAARADFSVGFSSPSQHRHHVYDTVVPHLATRHELENFRALFARLGVSGQSLPSLALTPAPDSSAKLFATKPFAVLHMFPGGVRAQFKQWPRDRWALLARGLVDRGLDVLFSGAPADKVQSEALAAEINDEHVRSLAGASLEATACALKDAAVVISVNTGIMHMAAALAALLVALNGPTSVDRWGPVATKGRAVALTSARACAPCLHLGFEYACAQGGCMADITVEAVLGAVDALLAGAGPSDPKDTP